MCSRGWFVVLHTQLNPGVEWSSDDLTSKREEGRSTPGRDLAVAAVLGEGAHAWLRGWFICRQA
jgi:hypothetical protein